MTLPFRLGPGSGTYVVPEGVTVIRVRIAAGGGGNGRGQDSTIGPSQGGTGEAFYLMVTERRGASALDVATGNRLLGDPGGPSRWKYYPPDWITESSYQRVGRAGTGMYMPGTAQGRTLSAQWGEYSVLYARVTPGERIPWTLGAGGSAGSSTYTFYDGPTSVYVTAGRPGGIDIAPVTEEPMAELEEIEDVDLYGEITPRVLLWIPFRDEGRPNGLRNFIPETRVLYPDYLGPRTIYRWSSDNEQAGTFNVTNSRSVTWSALGVGVVNLSVRITLGYSGFLTYVFNLQKSFTVLGVAPPIALPEANIKIGQEVRFGLPTPLELILRGQVWDRATYAWRTEPSGAGTFDSTTEPKATFSAGEEGEGTLLSFVVDAVFFGDGTRAEAGTSRTLTVRSATTFVGNALPADLTRWNTVEDGVWEETPAPGEFIELDKATMPLVMEPHPEDPHEMWVPHEVDWKNRLAGDRDTSPGPTFVQPSPLEPGVIAEFNPVRLEDIQAFQNRLVVLTADSIIFSAAGIPTLWWGASARQVFPSDPIDLFIGNQTPAQELWKAGAQVYICTPTEEYAANATSQLNWAPGNVRIDKAGEVVKDVTLGVHTLTGAIVVRNTDNLPTGLFRGDRGLQPSELASRTPDLLVDGNVDVTDMATLSAVNAVALTDGEHLYVGQQALERFAWSRHTVPSGNVLPGTLECPEDQPIPAKIEAVTGFGEDLLLLMTVGGFLCIERLYMGHQLINRIKRLTGSNNWTSYPCLDHALRVAPKSGHGMFGMEETRALDQGTGIELDKDKLDPESETPVWIGIPNVPNLRVTPLFLWNNPQRPEDGAHAPSQFDMTRAEIRHADSPAFDVSVILRGARPDQTSEYRTPVIGYTPDRPDGCPVPPGIPVDDGWFPVHVRSKAAELKLEIKGGINTGWKIQGITWFGEVKFDGQGV